MPWHAGAVRIERLETNDRVNSMWEAIQTFDVPTIRSCGKAWARARNAPPRVIDWEAHARMQTAARTQLALYAIALTIAKPHRREYRSGDVGSRRNS